MARRPKPGNRFGEALERARHEKGLDQRSLGRSVGIARSVISDWETGKRVPDREAAERCEKALGFEDGSLVRRREEEWVARNPPPSLGGRRWAVPALVAVAIAAVGFVVTRGPDNDPGSAPVLRTVAPTKTAFVNESQPDRDFGPNAVDFTSELFAGGDPAYVAYLQFELPPAPPGMRLTQAVLHIRTTDDPRARSDEPHPIWQAEDAWWEKEVTARNRPRLTPTTIGVIEARESATPYPVRLDAGVLKDLVGKPATFAVTSAGTTEDYLILWGDRYEKERYRPQLVLTFESGA
jgi:DNA-binding XRE family transcriptional regulator